jgi:hypothetical protein
VAHVRTHGVNRETAAALDPVWAKLELTPGAREVADRLRAVVAREGQQARAGETLVGSTEVLESVFGKLKRLEGSFSGDGFTSLSLILGALLGERLGERTEEQVRQALDTIPKKAADSLAQRLLGPTVHPLRRLFIKTADAVTVSRGTPIQAQLGTCRPGPCSGAIQVAKPKFSEFADRRCRTRCRLQST